MGYVWGFFQFPDFSLSMKLTAQSESWKLARVFTISRGSRTVAEVVTVQLEGEGVTGRGECTPYPRYGESTDQTLEELDGIGDRLASGEAVDAVLAKLHGGAVKNALDCAYWDWRCKREGKRVTELAGVPPLADTVTAFTVSLAAPEVMEAAARENAHRPVLKIKTGAERVVESVEAVRRGAPDSRLVVDANEAWSRAALPELLATMAALGVAFVEQPLPASDDAFLAKIKRPLPVVADESFHTSGDLERLAGRYDGVNIKLDKTGGFTEGLRSVREARSRGMLVMMGCMLGTSLAMAPGMVLAQMADFVDLDAPLLLAEDRPEGIVYDGSVMHPFTAALWG